MKILAKTGVFIADKRETRTFNSGKIGKLKAKL